MRRTRVAVVLWVVAGCAVVGLAPGQEPKEVKKDKEKKAAKPPLKISPLDQMKVNGHFKKDALPVYQDNQSVALREGSKRYSVVNVEFASAPACAKFEAKGVYVFSRFEEFADAFVDGPDGLKGLLDHPDVVWVESAGRAVSPPPDAPSPGEKGRDLPEAVARNGAARLTGKGVIVAVIDSGIDFHHPDFVTTDADGKPASRVLYFWDATADGPKKGEPGRPAPVSYPTGRPIGTVYSRQELTEELRARERRITVWDTNGHGTACAGIAAGNGNAAGKDRREERAGVAPEADIVAVRIGEGRQVNLYLLGAVCDWLDAVAREQDKPVVVSCSFGGDYGGRDGNRVAERRLDRRFPAGAKGRAICIAAGNSGDSALHAEVVFGGEKEKGDLTWLSPGYCFLSVYCDGDDPDDIVVGGAAVEMRMAYHHPLSRSVVLDLFCKPSGLLPSHLAVWSKSGKKTKADAYLAAPGPGSGFTGDCARYGKQVSSPACAAAAVAVGSYDFNSKFERRGEVYDYEVERVKGGRVVTDSLNVGELSAYSNPGPSRDGKVIKPDVVAPGQWWSAPAPMNVEVYRDTSGHYRLFSGTSAATPYAAGVVALMFEKKKTLTAGEVKTLLHDNASRNYPGARDKGDPAANPGWGYGKLDVKAVAKTLDAIK